MEQCTRRIRLIGLIPLVGCGGLKRGWEFSAWVLAGVVSEDGWELIFRLRGNEEALSLRFEVMAGNKTCLCAMLASLVPIRYVGESNGSRPSRGRFRGVEVGPHKASIYLKDKSY